MLVLSFHKSLSDAANVCVGNLFNSFCSSNVYPSKPICPSKPVCLRNGRPNKSIISSNFYVSKPVCPRNLFVQVMLVKVELMLVQVNPFVQMMFA